MTDTNLSPEDTGGKPAAKSRHGLFFFLMFVVPVLLLTALVLLRGNE
jgi:hypothetical protein